MNYDSYHITEKKLSNGVTYRAGDVIRVLVYGAFCDAVILGFNEAGDAKVSRPYAYVSLAGTVCPSTLLGCETYSIPASQLVLDKVIDTGRLVWF